MKKKKATPKSSPKKNETHNTSVKIQQSRILEALGEVGAKGMTTIQLREELDIMHPGGRVRELREAGHCIHTIWTTSENAQGNKHRCARSVLMRKSSSVALRRESYSYSSPKKKPGSDRPVRLEG